MTAKGKRIHAIAALLALLLAGGCGAGTQSVPQDQTSQAVNAAAEDETAMPADDTGADIDAVLAAYQPPADLFSVDLTAEDPSTQDIRFLYDEAGRIDRCTYRIDDQEVILSYSYDEDAVHIFGFLGSIIVADETIPVSGAFDPGAGFSVAQGYYLKGYTQ